MAFSLAFFIAHVILIINPISGMMPGFFPGMSGMMGGMSGMSGAFPSFGGMGMAPPGQNSVSCSILESFKKLSKKTAWHSQ